MTTHGQSDATAREQLDVKVGDRVTLKYDPRYADNEEVANLLVILVHDDDGSFDVQTGTGYAWTVLTSEINRGDVTVEVVEQKEA